MSERRPWLLIAGLTGMWLLLADHASVAQLLLGFGLSLFVVLRFRLVRPVIPQVSRPGSALRLSGRVLADILRSNLAVARIVLGLTGGREIRSGFIDIPLDLRDPHGLAVLAAIVTSTPGTVWTSLSADGAKLTLHVLDLRDEAALTATIKQRYERLIIEVFE